MNQWKTYILSCIWIPALIAQIILVIICGVYNEAGLDFVMYAGWAVWAISFVFGFLPILVFKRKGDVARGKSYVHTKKLVDTGLYSIVRHPQYAAGIFFSIALVLMAQNWLISILGLVVVPLLYVDIIMADKHEIEKFGNDYTLYMKRVPRMNFIWGIVKLIMRRKEEI